MKTQNFGWCLPTGWGAGPLEGREARDNYQEKRSNGGDEDSPARDIPLDGNYSGWIKCPDKDTLPSPLADGSYKEGWIDRDYEGWYRIRYQEGPGEKAWMEERDGNYLARLEREGQTAKAAELRASLPPTHPHYRPRGTTTPPSVVPAPAKADTFGGGAGAAPVTSLSLVEQATKKASAGDLPGTIKLCDQAIVANDADLDARRLRGQSYLSLYEKARPKRSKQRYLQDARVDFEFCFNQDKFDEASDEKVEEIDELLAKLASASFASSGSGAGAGAGASVASPPPSLGRATTASPDAESVAHALEAMAGGPAAGAGASSPSYLADSLPGAVPGPSYREDALAGAENADGPSNQDMSAMP